MQHIVDYLAMGGYARYVWPAYGITALVMIGLLLQTLRSYRARQRELDRLQAGREGRR